MELQQIADKLNVNCLQKVNPNRERWREVHLSWDIDYCRNFCYLEDVN
uniref:Uncharacterized protein n=1 Tax=viral metagenome TaxID=1070528 RepID=A0A6C0KSN5_9ZZZZ